MTTNLLVRTEFLEQHPDVVKALLEGQVDANEIVNDDPANAQKVVGEAIGKLTGKPLDPELVAQAWKT